MRIAQIAVLLLGLVLLAAARAPTTEEVAHERLQNLKKVFDVMLINPGVAAANLPTDEATKAAAMELQAACGAGGVDFGPIRGREIVTHSGSYDYYFSFCASVSSRSDCSSHQSAVCQIDTSQPTASQYTGSLGSWSIGAPPVWSVVGGNPTASFKNGDTCFPSTGGSMAREMTVTFVCGNGGDAISIAEPQECVYTLNVSGKSACGGSGGGGGKKKEGLSGGSIFLIILLVVVFLYVVIGCIYNWKRNGKRGLEACPQKAFWFAIPGLTKDGCAFTYGKIRGLCSKTQTTSSGEYETM